MSQLFKETRGYCALCWSRCGCISKIKDGVLISVEPDPEHPTGKYLCAKGRAAPETIYNEERILHPMKRTNPKDSIDPGWVRISWDEAMETVSSKLLEIAEKSGPEAVGFGITTPAGTAMSDGYLWVERFRRAFGSPNAAIAMELCGFSQTMVFPYTFGTPLPMPDYKNTDCIILWGHNPSTTWLSHSSRITEAKSKGAKLVVIDPRKVGMGVKADQWLRVRPGTDGALALGLANIIITESLFDEEFVCKWTNGPLLVRNDNGRFLSSADLNNSGDPMKFLAWDLDKSETIVYDSRKGVYQDKDHNLALTGCFNIPGLSGPISCSPAFSLYVDLCKNYNAEKVSKICWVEEQEIVSLARLIGSSKSLSIYMWSGLEMHTNASQTNRAIALLYSLTGNFDSKGGNVIFETSLTNDISGIELISNQQKEKALGLKMRPLGPETEGWITSDSLYNGILDGQPYTIRALMNFGKNFLLSHADAKKGEHALKSLEFMVHIDMFDHPTASLADIFLPVCSAWERSALVTNFSVDQSASGYMQFREPAIEPLGESQSDTWIVFELAKRMGLGDLFWNGNIENALQHHLFPSMQSLEELKGFPGGVQLDLETRYKKYADEIDGAPLGFATRTKKIEIYSELFLDNGYAALPEFVEPQVGPNSSFEYNNKYPLILTTAKSSHFLQSQNRNNSSLRCLERDPLIEINNETASKRGVSEGDWVILNTPHGSFRARASFSKYLHPKVIVATHGWWQSCEKISADGYPAHGPESVNINATIGSDEYDPIGGSAPLKSYICQVTLE